MNSHENYDQSIVCESILTEALMYRLQALKRLISTYYNSDPTESDVEFILNEYASIEKGAVEIAKKVNMTTDIIREIAVSGSLDLLRLTPHGETKFKSSARADLKYAIRFRGLEYAERLEQSFALCTVVLPILIWHAEKDPSFIPLLERTILNKSCMIQMIGFWDQSNIVRTFYTAPTIAPRVLYLQARKAPKLYEAIKAAGGDYRLKLRTAAIDLAISGKTDPGLLDEIYPNETSHQKLEHMSTINKIAQIALTPWHA